MNNLSINKRGLNCILSHNARRTCRIGTIKKHQYQISFQGFIDSHITFFEFELKICRKIKDALNWDIYIIVHTTLFLNDTLYWFMLKIIGTDIAVRSFLTKTITWVSKKFPCLSAPAVVSKIIGNTKNLTTGWVFWAKIKYFF